MRRRTFAAALWMALGPACGLHPHPEELVVCVPAGPATLEPNALNEEFTLSVVSNVYDTLVDLDADLALRPGLADSWHTPDDETWVFRLRSGVLRHDGRPLSAADVVTSLESARTDPNSKRRVQLASVRRIRASDSHTVVIETAGRFESLPLRLSNVHVWARGADGSSVGTGPYRVVESSPGGDTVLEAFAGYAGPKPTFPRARFAVVPDTHERLARLREGRADLVVDAPADAMAELSADPAFQAISRDGLRVLFLGMDCARETSPGVQGPRNPFLDLRVRRAVALAIDRQALVAGPLGGFGEVVEQLASPGELGGRRSPAAAPSRDVAAARELLRQAGWEAGFSVTLDYMPEKYRAVAAVVEQLVRDLADVGIEAVPRAGAPAAFMHSLETRAMSFYLMGWISDTGDAGLSYEYLLHSPRDGYGLDNGGGYFDPGLDRLIEEEPRLARPELRRARLERIAQYVREQVPVVPLYLQGDLYAATAGLAFRPRLDRRVRLAEIAGHRVRSQP